MNMDNSPWEQDQHIKDAIYATRMASRYKKLFLRCGDNWSWIYTRFVEINKLRKALNLENMSARVRKGLRAAENGEFGKLYHGEF